MQLTEQEKDVMIDILNEFERQHKIMYGLDKISGGFANADLDEDHDDKCIYFCFKSGVQSDCEDHVEEEHLKIDKWVLEAYNKGEISLKEVMFYIR